ncbi:MAG: hypothetical protein HY391_05915 [Deltaproteobacteria bacterium]|nr:hypothetical protein [Deltaproteobacteria bacterium]
MSESVVFCHGCSGPQPFVERVGFRDNCSTCATDLHCCFNCHFYDARAHNQCREPQADYVKDKERANYCEYFRPASGEEMEGRGFMGKRSAQSKAALAAAEKLFRKKG